MGWLTRWFGIEGGQTDLSRRLLSLDQVRRAQCVAYWDEIPQSHAGYCYDPERADGPLFCVTWLQPLPNIMVSAPYPTPCDYVACKPSELPPETGWWHLGGCDCEFCRNRP